MIQCITGSLKCDIKHHSVIAERAVWAPNKNASHNLPSQGGCTSADSPKVLVLSASGGGCMGESFHDICVRMSWQSLASTSVGPQFKPFLMMPGMVQMPWYKCQRFLPKMEEFHHPFKKQQRRL